MVFVVDEEKIIQYKNLESRYKSHKNLGELYARSANDIHQRMMKLSNEILKDAGVI